VPNKPKKGAALTKTAGKLIVVFGEDDYRVETAARREIADLFPKGLPDMAIEVIEGRVANQSEALRSLDRLFEALNTFSFFSSEKVIWWKNTNLLGDNVTSRAIAVSKRVGELVEALKEQGVASGTALLITADALDARRSFFKYAEKVGKIIAFKDEREAEIQAEAEKFAAEHLASLGVSADADAVSTLILLTDGDFRLLKSEIEKLAAYVGPGGKISEEDVRLLGSGRAGAIVWDLTGAFDQRNLSRAIQILDQLRYQQEEPIGLLFALISHVRQLLFLRELLDMKILKPAQNAGHFARQISQLPASVKAQLPQDKKWNPLLGNPYAVYHRLAGAQAYSASELRQAMRTLLECNEKLVSSGIEFDWLENAVLKILTGKRDVAVGNAVD
jgi:DNA polymerase III delta subunit